MPGSGCQGWALTARAAASALAKPPARSTASPSRFLFKASSFLRLAGQHWLLPM
jgi:hypothetical protein